MQLISNGIFLMIHSIYIKTNMNQKSISSLRHMKIEHVCDITRLRNEFYELGVLIFTRQSIFSQKYKLGVLIKAHLKLFRRA